MRFIKLSTLNNQIMLINTDKIVMIIPDIKDLTVSGIYLGYNSQDTPIVKESIGRIAELML